MITSVALAESGPLYATLRLTGRVAGCPSLTQDLTLYHTLARVDTATRVLRDATPNLELACAFPFLVEDPRFRYESCAAVVEPLRDQLPGSNTDYYAVQHWAEVSNARHGVVWASVDAPMAAFGGWWPGYLSGAHHGVRPPGYGHPFLTAGELTRGHIYSLLMTHNYRTNFLNARAGESLFRHAFTTRGAAAAAFGWGVADPLLAVWMKGPSVGGPRGGLSTSASFCRIDAPNVMLLAWKRAEDGDGFILRLIETEGRAAEATVTLPALRIRRACRTDLVEADQAPLLCDAHSVRLGLGPHAIGTIRVVAA